MSLWLIGAIALSGCATAGLFWSFAMALSESTKTATGVYEDEMTNTLESMFLFIPAKKLVDLSIMAAATVFLISRACCACSGVNQPFFVLDSM